MVMVNLQGQQVSMDGYLVQKLENVKDIVHKRNFDCVIIIDGKERIGKSTLGLQIGTYLDQRFSVNNIAADADEAVKKIEHLPDKSVLLIDEGSLVLSSRDTMRKETKKLLKILNVVGQKNMVFIIVLPSFFELNKYIATDRARFLIHCYSDEKLNRGRFAYFGTPKLKKLYEFGKKYYGSYARPHSDFIGRFLDFKPHWYKEYLDTKKKSLMAALNAEESSLTPGAARWKAQRDILIHMITNNKWATQQQIVDEYGKYGFAMQRNNISNILREFAKENG